mmetsp:Transcript_39048/g.82131  ORF Transcript_39048/g.82131 Transcript_39048/m.82131 type:complete len:343 (+) Transcript_39048:75-1103(+)
MTIKRKMDAISSEAKYWSAEDLHLGKLLLAVADMQSFIHDNWTSAKARHRNMPTSSCHWTRSQMKHSSMLAVHARPIPEECYENRDGVSVEVYIRRKKLSEAWETMQSFDTDLWADVCDLYAMVVAVDKDPVSFEGVEYVLNEVAEAKALMQNAELIAAIKIIVSYKQEEWKQENSPSCVRRGSMLIVHEHHSDESQVEARVRHREHAEAWEKMKSCSKAQWVAACLFHEEQNQKESKIAKLDKLDAACWVTQDFNSKAWTSELISNKTLPKSIRCITPNYSCTRVSCSRKKQPVLQQSQIKACWPLENSATSEQKGAATHLHGDRQRRYYLPKDDHWSIRH